MAACSCIHQRAIFSIELTGEDVFTSLHFRYEHEIGYVIEKQYKILLNHSLKNYKNALEVDERNRSEQTVW